MSRREDLLSGAEYLASIYGTEKDKVSDGDGMTWEEGGDLVFAVENS